MPAPALPSTFSLHLCREELVFTQARCLADPAAESLVHPITQVLDAWSDVHSAQLALWDAQVRADALVTRADEALDAFVDRFAAAALAVVGQNREDSRYTLYFKTPPSSLKAPVLGPQLETLKGWASMLGTETEPSLAAFAKELKPALQRAVQALKARTTADADNEKFRKTGPLSRYLRDVTSARDALFVSLDAARADHAKDRKWPNGFFRKRAATKPSSDARAAKEAKADAKKAHAKAVAEAAAKVKEAQKALRDAKKKK